MIIACIATCELGRVDSTCSNDSLSYWEAGTVTACYNRPKRHKNMSKINTDFWLHNAIF